MQKEKESIRKYIADKKKQSSTAQFENWSTDICLQIEMHQVFKDANHILIYHHLPDEVQTSYLLTHYRQNKQFLLPVVRNGHLIIKQYEGENELKPGVFGILEPTGEEFSDLEKIDLIIVPGIAFDKEKNRLGRGKGYYDKLLTQTKAFKIGVCFPFQLLETIPVENFDIPMDLVITTEQYP